MKCTQSKWPGIFFKLNVLDIYMLTVKRATNSGGMVA